MRCMSLVFQEEALTSEAMEMNSHRFVYSQLVRIAQSQTHQRKNSVGLELAPRPPAREDQGLGLARTCQSNVVVPM